MNKILVAMVILSCGNELEEHVSLQASEDVRPANVTVGRLRALLTETERRLDSLLIDYRGFDRDQPPGSYSRRVLCTKRPGYFFHELSHGTAARIADDDPLLKRNYLVRDSAYTVFPFSRQFKKSSFSKGHTLPISAFGSFFLATGLWPLDYWPAPRWEGKPVSLKEIGMLEKELMIRSRQALIRGRWCHVVEHGGKCVIWVDVQRGCCVMAREFSHDLNAMPSVRFDLGGHVRYEPGIWLPSWIRVAIYDVREARTNMADSEPAKLGTLTIDVVKVNSEDASLFRYQPPPGAVTLNDDGELEQVVAGGLDMIDEMVLWIRRHHATALRCGTRHGWPVWVVCALAVLVAVLRYLRRRWPMH